MYTFQSKLGDERLDDRVESLLDDFLRLELGEPDLFRDGPNNLFLGHDSVLL